MVSKPPSDPRIPALGLFSLKAENALGNVNVTWQFWHYRDNFQAMNPDESNSASSNQAPFRCVWLQHPSSPDRIGHGLASWEFQSGSVAVGDVVEVKLHIKIEGFFKKKSLGKLIPGISLAGRFLHIINIIKGGGRCTTNASIKYKYCLELPIFFIMALILLFSIANCN